jgi:hypothetical protein
MTTTDNVVMAETQAIRLLREGYSPAQIFDKTGVTKDRLSILANSFGGQRAPAVQPRPPLPPARPLTSLAAPRERDVLAELIADGKASRVGAVRSAATNVERAIEKLRTAMAGAAERERALAAEAVAKEARKKAVADAERALKAAQEQLRAARGAARGNTPATPRPAPVPRPDGVEKVPVDERRRRIPELVAQGLNDSQIGRLLGVSSGQIYQDRKAIEKAGEE